MKDNRIKNVTDNIRLPEDAKERIKASCVEYGSEENNRSCIFGMKTGVRIAAAAACLVALSVTAYAMSELTNFSFKRDNDTVLIGVKLSEDVKTDVATEPVRAWNADEGEISMKLNFAYMPEDMKENETAQAKWDGTADYNRCITFTGFDLRRSDLETMIDGIDDAECFMAGENEAYLITSDSEIAVYNKELYILFADEQFVVEAVVGCGITEEEIKAIASGMTVEETDDVSEALPIANEFYSDVDISDIPVEIVLEEEKVFESDLLSIGDTGEYNDFFDDWSVTVESLEYLDSIADLDPAGFHDLEKMKLFTDDDGKFVPYKRTGVDWEKGKFTETVNMTKRMICVTVQIDGTVEDTEYIKAYLHGFNLAGLEVWDDGTVHPSCDVTKYVIDRIPGKNSGNHEAVYKQNLGDGRWVVGYILDEDECEGDLFYYNREAETYYSFEK